MASIEWMIIIIIVVLRVRGRPLTRTNWRPRYKPQSALTTCAARTKDRLNSSLMLELSSAVSSMYFSFYPILIIVWLSQVCISLSIQYSSLFGCLKYVCLFLSNTHHCSLIVLKRHSARCNIFGASASCTSNRTPQMHSHKRIVSPVNFAPCISPFRPVIWEVEREGREAGRQAGCETRQTDRQRHSDRKTHRGGDREEEMRREFISELYNMTCII